MRRILIAFIFVAFPLGSALIVARPGLAQQAPAESPGFSLASLDRTTDPCADFYQYACGGWMASHPIPPDRSTWATFDELQDRNNDILRQILEAAAAKPTSDTRKIGDYYASCMDETLVNAKGTAPLGPELDRIASLTNRDQLPGLLAELHPIGVNAFFGAGSEPDIDNADIQMAVVAAGGLGLPDRDYYFRDDAKSVELRAQYVDHVGKMIQLVDAKGDGKTASATVMRVETALAMPQLDVVARRDPAKVNHRMKLSELQALTPRFNWRTYFTAIGAPAFTTLNVTQPDYLKALDAFWSAAPIADIREYLRWQLVHANAAILPTSFVNENFRFYGTILSGTPQLRPRWKRCVSYTDGDLGEALGKAYVARTFGAQAKANTLAMVKAVESSLARDISTLTWMTERTRAQALDKLRAVSDKIGYPDKWRDYSKLRIVRGDALGNSQRANAFEFRREIDRIGKLVNRREWEMTPPTVNAYYDPTENNINFPAGILQPPFYHGGGDRPTNFGAAGSVVGHELTHGFDDQGRHYDAKGNLRDWWTPEDARNFDSREQCFVDEYNGFKAVDDVHVNGKLTLGENTADNGGLRLALSAYLATAATRPDPDRDGFTAAQRLFIGFAQIWCENARPEAVRLRVQTNPHSPGRFRANGVVSNMPEFAQAFSCKPDAPMVRQNACRVW
ncbi:MAG TPA: M13 family metallopeptidase [Vicinamibacterales bacterium]|nr:M13 family metallopeptidase [Vicinamibacterales bacterium]